MEIYTLFYPYIVSTFASQTSGILKHTYPVLYVLPAPSNIIS